MVAARPAPSTLVEQGVQVGGPPGPVWYVSYGSNMSTDRLTCYLAGGIPPGALRPFPGCRDPTPARRARGIHLAGGVYFATWSPVWAGGRAFYDPGLPGTAPARGHLVTAEQFCDIADQEMYRPPGSGGIDLVAVIAAGSLRVGSGRYETLLHVGTLDGSPMLTFTAPWSADAQPPVAPSAPYLRMLAAGLREGHDWDARRVAEYLASLPGARGHWTAPGILAELG